VAEPTKYVREAVYNRDGRACITCGARVLSFQHRKAVGMGGSPIAPEPEEGLTACSPCNGRYERDLQLEALLKGWKVRKWAYAPLVPVFYPHSTAMYLKGWYRLEDDQRYGIDAEKAELMMRDVYGSLYDDWKGQAA